MRVLLVNPPRSRPNAIYEWAPPETQRFIHRKLIGPPLGLLTLATAIRSEHDVLVLDLKGEYDLDPAAPPPSDLLGAWLDRFQPQVVGVTFIASEQPAGLELLRSVKARDPRLLTVAGGLQAQLCPEDLADPAVDVVVLAAAPRVFRELLARAEEGRPLDSVPGLGLPTEAGLQRTAKVPAEWQAELRHIEAPDRGLLDRWRSTYRVGPTAGLSTYLYTSLGCPYRCSFCSVWPQFQGAYLQRDLDSIVRELATLDDYEVVRFADGNSVVQVDFMRQLFTRIEQAGVHKKYVMDIRVDTIVREPRLIEQMARQGLKVVIAGFESFRDAELEQYQKRTAASAIGEAVAICHQNGIMLRGNYVIPPWYEHRDFDELEDFAARHPVALAGYTIMTPMPGTALYRESLPEIFDFDLEKYNFFNCVLRTKLPLETFYERVGDLWRIRLGSEVI